MHRSFQVADGKGGEVRAYLSEIAEYVMETYGVEADVFVEVFGPTTASGHMMMDFEDLTAFEKFWSQLGADVEFGKLLDKEAEIRIEGTVGQSLLHSHR